MADILRIFKRDMCGIFRNVLVLIIVIGLCVLPALYAWLISMPTGIRMATPEI